jgi:Spherulation-specific family 4
MRTRSLVLGALVAVSPLLLPAASASAGVPTSSEHIITTLYTDPTASSWSQVEASAPAVSASILDICAADGSGSGGCMPNPIPWDEQPPTTWNTLITNLQNSGITPLIYIATDYADTGAGSGPTFTLSTVESEVSEAVGWYGKNIGFMFDEGATTCALESSYYLPLYNYVKSVTSNGTVEINAGTVNSTMSCYMSATNILQVFEGTESSFQAATFPSWMTSYPARQFAATISAGTSTGVGTDVTHAGNNGIGNVYVDDEAGTPNYATLPVFWSAEVTDAAAAQPKNPFQALCDLDGPCLNATSSAAGHSVDMASFSSGDTSEALALFGYGGDYGCTKVTATCPFHNTALDTEYLGEPLINLTFTSLSGQPAAATYPNNNVNTEAVGTAPDRDVYVLDPNCGASCAYLLSPYWTNQNGVVEALYGPPLGTQASVNTFTGSTRQSWVDRS